MSILLAALLGLAASVGNWTPLHPQGDAGSPPSRYYHSVASNATGPKYLFGGLEEIAGQYVPQNDMWINTMGTWRQASMVTGGPPPARAYATFTFIGDNKFLLFGGKTEPPMETYFNDTWVFDATNMTWMEVHPVNDGPEGRFYHSSQFINGSVYVFGGAMRPNTVATNDVWRLECATMEWMQLRKNATTPDAPHPRQGHSAITFSTGFVVYGGRSGVEKGAFGDTWWYDFTTNDWTQLDMGMPQSSPAPRAAHTAVLIQGRMIVFGGSFISLQPPYVENFHNDVWSFDPRAKKWSQLQPDDGKEVMTRPWKRKGHSAQVVMGMKMAIFGGYGLFQGVRNDLWLFSM